jgi:peptidoglycan/LPS O-acetylase OafA/YrhL
MICLGLCLFLVYIPLGLRFIGLPIAYVIVYAGLRNPRKIKLLEKGDYSYGIYLYGTPLQQVVYAFGGIGATLVGNFAFASIFAICVAAMSWHFIELPIMSRKKLSYKIEGEILRRLPNSLKVALSIKLQDERPPELAPKRA